MPNEPEPVTPPDGVPADASGLHQSGNGRASSTGSAAIEKAKMSLVRAACQYACAEDWCATPVRADVLVIFGAMREKQIAELRNAATQYFRAVCGEPLNEALTGGGGAHEL